MNRILAASTAKLAVNPQTGRTGGECRQVHRQSGDHLSGPVGREEQRLRVLAVGGDRSHVPIP
eukprot:3087844-Alexandrium_andersonii.AAC.1